MCTAALYVKIGIKTEGKPQFLSHSISLEPDSSVGIANSYGLDGPEIESRWGRGFPHPFRRAVRAAHPPIH
jgi:hypothetical protein